MFGQIRKLVRALRAGVVVRRQHLVATGVLFGLALSLWASPAFASFEIDMNGMMQTASDMFNGLWPAFAVVVGLGLGVAILNFIVRSIRSAF